MKSYIELQVPLRNDAQWFEELRTKMSEQGVNVRWQNDFYHITVVFVNEIVKQPNIHAFAPIYKCLSYKAAPHLTFDTLDAFTSKSGEHIVYLTSSCPSEEIREFVNNIRKTIDEAGWIYEPDFLLHVTLGRISSKLISLEELKKLISQVSMPSFTLQLFSAKFIKLENHEVLEKYKLYPDKESAKVAEEERKRQAFMNALGNFQIFADPDF